MTHPPRVDPLLSRSSDGSPGDAERVRSSDDRRSFPAVMWRHKLALVAGVLVGALLGLGLSLVQPAAFTAESRIFYSSQGGFDPLSGDSFNSDPSRYLEQQAALLTSEPVLAQAVRAEPAIGAAEQVRKALTVTASREADIVIVRAAADSAATAEARADAVVVAYRAYQRTSVQQQTRSLQALSDGTERRQILQRAALYGDGVELVEPPVTTEVSTRIRNATVGALVGFLVALVGAVVADARRSGRSADRDVVSRRRGGRTTEPEGTGTPVDRFGPDETRAPHDLDELLEPHDEVWRGSRNRGR